MNQRPVLIISQLKDAQLQQNFRSLQDFFDKELVFTGFKFFTLTFLGAEPHHKFQHNMGFVPQDILLTSKTGSGVVTFNQDLTDNSTMDLTVTGPCVIRFIAGTFG